MGLPINIQLQWKLKAATIQHPSQHSLFALQVPSRVCRAESRTRPWRSQSSFLLRRSVNFAKFGCDLHSQHRTFEFSLRPAGGGCGPCLLMHMHLQGPRRSSGTICRVQSMVSLIGSLSSRVPQPCVKAATERFCQVQQADDTFNVSQHQPINWVAIPASLNTKNCCNFLVPNFGNKT